MESAIIEDIKAEKQIYELLRFVFWQEPTKDFLCNFLKAEKIDEENEIDRGLNLMYSSVRRNEEQVDTYCESLAIEFARLFIGPNTPVAIPFASFYLSENKLLMTEVTIDIRKKYLETGMAAKHLHKVPDDHISTELEFLAFVCQETINSFEKNDRTKASQYYEIMSDFLSNHLALWAPIFAGKILESPCDDFYKGAALALKGIIKEIG